MVSAGRSCSLAKSALAEWARRGTPRQVEYLTGYLEAECASRDASKRANLLRRCALSQAKTFDGYEWGQIEWPDGFGKDDLLSLSFLDDREDLVLMGDVGTGKTHMAEALCAPACGRALPARFFTASSLVMRLRRARDDGRLDRKLAQLGGAGLLAIDELGFPPARCRRSEAALPGGLRGLRDAVRGPHGQPRVSRGGAPSSGTTRWPRP